MSTSGLTQTYQPNTLDGLNVIEADQIYLDGQLVNLNNFVPYISATQVLNMGPFAVQSSHIPSSGNDLINYTTLVGAITNQDVTNSVTFLNKITTTSQTVAGSVTFQNDVDLMGKVVTGTNYQTSLTSADVVVLQNLGSITNSGGIYQATTTLAGDAILTLFPITLSQRIAFSISFLIQDSETWTIDLYESPDGIVSPYGLMTTLFFPPSSTAFQTFSLSFVPQTTGIVVARISGATTGVTTCVVEWKDMATYGLGVSLTNVTMPSLGADRVAVINDKKQLVSSGISVTKLDYLDNVSSDIQTQLNGKASTSYVDAQDSLRVPYTGATTALDMGSNKITTTYVPVNGADLINKTYADGAYATTSALAGYLPLTGGTLTGDLSQSATKMISMSGQTLRTLWVTLGFTASSFQAIAIPVLGIVLGTISNPSAWRLTPASGQANSAMSLTGFTYTAGETYQYIFTGITSSLSFGQITVFQYDSGGLITTPVYYNVSTSPTNITGSFTIPPSGGDTAFVFTGAFANQWVEWAGFILSRTDVAIAGGATVAGLLTSGSNLSVLGGATVSGATACNTITTTGNVSIGTTTTTAGPLTIYEATGSAGTGSTGSIVLRHGNTNGSQSIVFTSANNLGSDYGFIQFIDTVAVSPYTQYNYFNGSGSEVCALVIGCQNDGKNGSGPDTVIIACAGIVLDPTKTLGASAGTYIVGNVGIGSTNPTSPLVIQYDGGEGQYIVLRNPQYVSAGFTGIEFNHNDTRYSRIDSYLAGSNRTFLRFFTGNTGGGETERFTLTDYGAFLTGTLRFANNGAGLYWGDGYSRIVDDGNLRIATDDTMHFYTGSNTSTYGTERMRIDPGITRSYNRFYVGTAADIGSQFCVYDPTSNRNTHFGYGGDNYIGANTTYFDGKVVHNAPILLNINGSVSYVGNGALQVRAIPNSSYSGRAQDCISCIAWQDGNYIIPFFNSADGFRGVIAGVNSSSVSYNTSSDRRLKDNVHTIEDSLDIVRRLNPVHFRWIRDDEWDFGFIAQDVYKVLPQMRPNLTNYIKDCTCKRENLCCGEQCEHCLTMNDEPVDEEGQPRYYSLDYGKFTPYLVGAVQEQQKQIEDQAKRLEKLEIENLRLADSLRVGLERQALSAGQVLTLEAREAVWVEHARQQEATIKAQAERLAKAEAGLEKMAGLVAQLISKA